MHTVCDIVPSGGHFHLSSLRIAWAGMRKAKALAWNKGNLIMVQKHINTVTTNHIFLYWSTQVNSPDTKCSLYERSDPHTGEDGAD